MKNKVIIIIFTLFFLWFCLRFAGWFTENNVKFHENPDVEYVYNLDEKEILASTQIIIERIRELKPERSKCSYYLFEDIFKNTAFSKYKFKQDACVMFNVNAHDNKWIFYLMQNIGGVMWTSDKSINLETPKSQKLKNYNIFMCRRKDYNIFGDKFNGYHP